MNRPILCCLKIKSATLLIGILDLIFHITLLATFFASYSHPNFFDHYYTNSISLLASSSSSCLSSQIMYPSEHKTSEFGSPIALPVVEQIQYPSAAANPIARAPLPIHLDEPRHYKMQQNSIRQLDSISGLSYSQYNQDKSIVLLITTFSSLITIMLIYGIIKKRPSYLMPYFSIKVFQVVMASLTTLGFYSCLPNVRIWIQNHHYFPFKRAILLLDNQTLELFVFSILLASILVKLYTVIIVWYCYRYMITLESFRNLGSLNSNGCGTDDSNSGFKFDDESLVSQPPKYDEIMKQIKEEKSQTQNGAAPTTSNLVNEQSDNESSSSSGLVPSYFTAVAGKNRGANV